MSPLWACAWAFRPDTRSTAQKGHLYLSPGHLERAHQSPKSGFYPIYGRRRIGKTELIRHFLRDKPGIYFLGKKASRHLELREFLRQAAVAFEEPLLAEASISEWKRALVAVTERAPESRLEELYL